jgi:hypothetical protein
VFERGGIHERLEGGAWLPLCLRSAIEAAVPHGMSRTRGGRDKGSWGEPPDDVLAAERAKKKMNIISVGFLAASESPRQAARELKKTGADYVCAKSKELIKILK